MLNITSKKKTLFFFSQWKNQAFQLKILLQFFHPRRERKQIPLLLLKSQVHRWQPERSRRWEKLQSNFSAQDTPKQTGLSQTSFYCYSFTSHFRGDETKFLHPALTLCRGDPIPAQSIPHPSELQPWSSLQPQVLGASRVVGLGFTCQTLCPCSTLCPIPG